MATKRIEVKISKAVVDYIKQHQCKLKYENYALVGILASSKKDGVIDNVYFIKRERGCKWFPRMERKSIVITLCKVIKEKKEIRGLVTILAQNENNSGISSWFDRMIIEKNWVNTKFVYLVRNRYDLNGYRIETRDYFTKVKLITVKEE